MHGLMKNTKWGYPKHEKSCNSIRFEKRELILFIASKQNNLIFTANSLGLTFLSNAIREDILTNN
jgi:hypothetical protein